MAYCKHGGKTSSRVADALNAMGYPAFILEGGLEAWIEAGHPTVKARADLNAPGASRWVTRERPKIDRLACPWLVRRFIDPRASFFYTPAHQVRAESQALRAEPYDIADVTFSHRGARCSFDAFLDEFDLHDPVIDQVANIVRAADTGELGQSREAPGLLAISLGTVRQRARRHRAAGAGDVGLRCALRLVQDRPQRNTFVAAESRDTVSTASPISFGEALRLWTKIGWLSFGGPAGQIALMHRELVERRRWISETRFLHALNYCMLLPGPEAQQLATYIGWLLHRTWGGIVAGGLFVLPGMLVMLVLSWLYVRYSALGPVAALFFGLKAAVLAVVVEAVLRIGRRALRNRFMVALAAAAFLAIYFFKVPFPWIVAGAALIGLVARRIVPQYFEQAPPADSARGEGLRRRSDVRDRTARARATRHATRTEAHCRMSADLDDARRARCCVARRRARA